MFLGAAGEWRARWVCKGAGMRILVLLGLSNVLAAASVAGPADEIARIYAQAIGGPCATRWDNQARRAGAVSRLARI